MISKISILNKSLLRNCFFYNFSAAKESQAFADYHKNLLDYKMFIDDPSKMPFDYNTINKIAEETTPEELQRFKDLRIYKYDSNFMLANKIVVNKALQKKVIVMNADKMNAFSNKVLGQTLTETLTKKSIGKIFTAGSNLDELLEYIEEFKKRGVRVIIDYCCEAVEGGATEMYMDKCTEVFNQTIKQPATIQTEHYTDALNIISVKFSGLINIDTLKKINMYIFQVQNIFFKCDQAQKHLITIQQLVDQLKTDGLELSEQDAKDFLVEILNRKPEELGDIYSHEIDMIDWRALVHGFYVDHKKNENKVISFLCPWSVEEKVQLENFVRRLDQIFENAYQYNTRILVDAEQTFIQTAIDQITEQYQFRYNRDQNSPVVFNTFQSYLKMSQQRIIYEIAKCKRYKQPIGIKLVRGAYMFEEKDLAEKYGYENPIVDNFDQTSVNIEANIKHIFDNLDLNYDEIIVASHNKGTIRKTQELMAQGDIDRFKSKVFFGQLQGLSDHLTYDLIADGYKTYKYIPFGETFIMIPYLIRRAQESFQVLKSVKEQEALLKDELKQRMKLK